MDQLKPKQQMTTIMAKAMVKKKFIDPKLYKALYHHTEVRKNQKPGYNIPGFLPSTSHILTRTLKRLGHTPANHWVYCKSGLVCQAAFPEKLVKSATKIKDKVRSEMYKAVPLR